MHNDLCAELNWTFITCAFCCGLNASIPLSLSLPLPLLHAAVPFTSFVQCQLVPCASLSLKNGISCRMPHMPRAEMSVAHFKTNSTDIAHCCAMFAVPPVAATLLLLVLLLPSVGFRLCSLQLCMQINGRSRRARTMAVLIWKVPASRLPADCHSSSSSSNGCNMCNKIKRERERECVATTA